MDRKQLREYRARWQAAAEVEAEELKQATIVERWRQFEEIMRLAAELGLPLDRPEGDEMAVWERWARLKAGLP